MSVVPSIFERMNETLAFPASVRAVESAVGVTVMLGPPADELATWLRALALPSPSLDDASRIDRIRLLEQIKSAAAAAQAEETVAFKASQVAAQQAAGVPARDVAKGIGLQVALARQESPHKAARLMGLASALLYEMPYTFEQLRSGCISEWRATLVVRETACLSKEDRGIVDQRLGGRLARLSDGRVAAETRRHAYQLDPVAAVARASKAAAERCVTLRPAPDTMTYLTGLLPVVQGVAVLAALTRVADVRRAEGDSRSRGQVMADTLVERVTGQSTADKVPVELQIVMTHTALLDGDATPAHVNGYGPVPAALVRNHLAGLGEGTAAWLRRLYTRPDTGQLAAMDSTRRLFDGNLARHVNVRDQVCRTPWCGAPIRHHDHVISAADGGDTSTDNGQGLCEACNYAKEAAGWQARPGPAGAGDIIEITTPTGHTYRSSPPPLPGALGPPPCLVDA